MTNILLALMQKLDETDLQVFVVGNAATQCPRNVLHRGCQFAYIDFGGANSTEVCQTVLKQLGLKFICNPFADSSFQKRNLSSRG